jgi:hypothetical protein
MLKNKKDLQLVNFHFKYKKKTNNTAIRRKGKMKNRAEINNEGRMEKINKSKSW